MAEEIYEGACLCTDISFTITGKPGKVLGCYCSDCQKNAGGPYQVIASCPTSTIQVRDSKNLLKVYTITEGTQSGHPKEKHFCGQCGCTLWTVPLKYEGKTRMVRTSLIEDGLAKFPVEKTIFNLD